MKLGYLACGNKGTVLRLFSRDKHPRGQLLEKLGIKSAKKVYADMTSGETRHLGYYARGEWFDIFEVHDWNNKE